MDINCVVDKNKYKKDIKDKNLLRVIEKATNKNDEYKYENIKGGG